MSRRESVSPWIRRRRRRENLALVLAFILGTATLYLFPEDRISFLPQAEASTPTAPALRIRMETLKPAQPLP